MKKLPLIIFCTALFFSGCGYGDDVDKQAFVVAVGIDKGESFPLKATFVFANPGNGGGGSEEKSPSTPKPDIVTVEAPTVFSAVRKLDAIKSKRLNLSHTKIVIFSETLAQSGVKKYLSGFASSRDFRPNTYVCVSKGDAQEYLKSVKPSQETFIEKYYDNIMQKVAEDKVNEAYLYYFYFNTAENFSGSLVPLVGLNKNDLSGAAASLHTREDDFTYDARAGEILRDGENPAEILGCAVFKNDKMLDTLGSFETDMARIICNEYYPKNYSLKYPHIADFVTIRLMQQKNPQIKTSIKNGNAQISITVPVSIEYVDAGKIENNKKKSDEFCSYLKSRLDMYAKSLLTDSQLKYNADILGLGKSLKRHFTDIDSWEKFNWEEKFSAAQIKISFEVEYADFEEAN